MTKPQCVVIAGPNGAGKTSAAPELLKDTIGVSTFVNADVIAQGLGMLRAQEEFIRSNAGELREKIASGLAQIQQGNVVDGRAAIQSLRNKLHERERSGRRASLSQCAGRDL